MPELLTPTVRLEAAWRDAHLEWGPGSHEDGFGLLPDDDVESPAGFANWLARLARQSDLALPPPAGRVRCTYRWIVEDDRVLGGIALRHELQNFNEHLGHIGFGIRPSARRRGIATWALGQVLLEARHLGLGRVLLVCAVDNVASARTIEHHGGVLEDDGQAQRGEVRRYWIELS